MRKTVALALFTLASIASSWASPTLIQAGPMLGHASEDSVSVWLRLKRGALVKGTALQRGVATPVSHWQDLGADCHVLRFTGLKADALTQIDLQVERAGSEPEKVSLETRTYPEPSDTGEVRLAFGSCSKISQYPKGPIYAAIEKEAPHMMVFLGDNAYFIVADGSDKHFTTTGPVGDWTTADGMRARHLMTRMHPDLQGMFRRVPSYAVWDDHDYGPNNADRTFPLREEALYVFKEMWANPSWGTAETPGIFSHFRCGPVEVFLMDDRYHKYSPLEHDDVSKENGALWGEEQLTWLLEKLRASTAPVKVIANGTQVICKDGRGEGHQTEAVGEFHRLATTLAEQEIGGVVFISGDRHHSEAMQQAQPDGTLLVEATSSPLQQDQDPAVLDRHHVNQIWGMRGNNYGLLTVTLTNPNEGTVTFETRDATNATHVVAGKPCKTTWTLSQLQYGEH